MPTKEKWDRRFLNLCNEVAEWSKDPSTQVGAVIIDDHRRVLSLGYNGLPRGVNDNILARSMRPEKYYWYEHAERNAIYNAAAHGIALAGATLYVTIPPCTDCARAIVQTGIVRVVANSFTTAEFRHRWSESNDVAYDMFHEANVAFRIFGKDSKK